MQEEKCLLDPQRDCLGLKRADEVAGDLKSLDRRLTSFQQAVSETNNRFGGRIGRLEAHNEVQDEQMRQIKETQVEIKREIAEAQKEQKNSMAELRATNLGELGNRLLSFVNAAFVLLSLLGVVNDPTTAGITDSRNAMTYHKPKED